MVYFNQHMVSSMIIDIHNMHVDLLYINRDIYIDGHTCTDVCLHQHIAVGSRITLATIMRKSAYAI